MSADNLIRIVKKDNGLFQVRHESASSLVHALAGVEPTPDELLLGVIADDVDETTAHEKAISFEKECEAEGYGVEYGIVDESFKKPLNE